MVSRFRTLGFLRAWKENNLQSKGLNTLLNELQGSGTTDSSGAFTLSADKAREKLAKYSLPEPRFYVLNLVASAVASGATWVKVGLSSSYLTFEFDGRAFSEKELEGLLDQLINPTDKRLFELGVALNAVRVLEPKNVEVISCDGVVWAQLHLSGGDYVKGKAATATSDAASPFTRITVTEKQRFSRTTNHFFSVLPEETALKRTASYAPPDISINENSFSQAVSLGAVSPTCMAWTHVLSSGPKLRVQKPSLDWSPECLICQAHDNEKGEYEAVLILDRSEPDQSRKVLIVNNGVSFHRPASLFDTPFAQVVISTSLNKNLSHTDLAEDDTYFKLIDNIQCDLDEMVIKRLESPLPLPSKELVRLWRWSSTLEARVRQRGRTDLADRVKLWRTESDFQRDILNRKKWASLLEQLALFQTKPEGDALAQRMECALSEAGLRTLESSLHHDCHKCCERLNQLYLLRSDSREDLADILSITGELSGKSIVPSHHLSDGVRADLLLVQGHFQEAADLSPHPKAHGLLAVGDHQKAENLLRKSLLKNPTTETLEALADCLAFSNPSNRKRRKEALGFKERARELHESLDIAWGNFLLNDLVNLARSTLPWNSWLSYRMKAVVTGEIASELAQKIESDLATATSKLAQGSAAIIRVTSTILAAERQLPLDHPFLDACRGRAAHCLRRAQYWAEAEQLLARGRLLKRLSQSLKTSTSREG